MDFEKEINDLKCRIAVAEQDGRNPLAITGKFDTIFSLILQLQEENAQINERIRSLKSDIEQLNFKIANIQVITDLNNEANNIKRSPGRPKRED